MTRILTLIVAGALLAGVGWTLVAALRLNERPSSLPEVNVDGASGEIVVTSSDEVVLRFEAPPRRILPTNASVVDLLDALVVPERIAALPAQTATYARIREDDERYRGHRRFSRYDAETVLGFAPDLVIAGAFNNPETHARLRERGIPVLRLDIRNGMDEVVDALRMLGRLLGVSDRAEAEIVKLNRRREALAARTTSLAELRVLSYSNLGTGGWSFGTHSTLDEVFGLAGMRNAGAETGRNGAISLSFEELVTLDPDLILVSGAGAGEEAASTSADVLRGESVLAGLKARQEGGILIMPPRLVATSSQEMLTAAEHLADLVLAWRARRAAK